MESAGTLDNVGANLAVQGVWKVWHRLVYCGFMDVQSHHDIWVPQSLTHLLHAVIDAGIKHRPRTKGTGLLETKYDVNADGGEGLFTNAHNVRFFVNVTGHMY